uniref:Molybdenum cofactor biosynthesis protein MoaE n=1 Tax=Archaeoglobus fulgidus TaxID=2234 RepID=A0A7C3R9K0_ARCFL
MTSGAKNIRDALETLADMGFDYAAILDFELELEGLEKGLGFRIPKVRSVEEVERAPEIESLKSLVLKTKCVDGVERCGAIGIFVGFVRKESGGKTVSRLEYEAYDEMLNEKVREIEERIKQMPGIVNARIYHRRGILMPGEDIVYVAVMGEHRKDIWEPLKEAVEMMKKELPVWKKEVYEDGEVWVHDAERD